MMIRFLTLGVMVLALAIFGCGRSEESKSTQGTTETVTEKMAEAAKTSAGAVKETAEAVAEKAAEIEEQTEPAVKELVEETKEKSATAANKTEEMARQAAEETREVIAEAKEATSEAADTASQKATSAAAAITMVAGEAAEAAKQVGSPETIVLEASYGNVTFPHATHADAYDCATCHGEDAPGLFGLDKEKAHTLCKECHKQEGAGPTDCKGCHKK